MPTRAWLKRLWGKNHQANITKDATTAVNANTIPESHIPKLDPANISVFVAASTTVLANSDSLGEPSSKHTLEVVSIQNEAPKPIQDLNLNSLWDEAYDELRKEDAKLVDAYERDLLAIQDLEQRAPEGDDREMQLQKLLNSKLQDIEHSQMRISIHGKDVVIKDQVRKVVHSILSVKDYIGTVASVEPHAALVWTGVMIILPAIANPITQDDDAMEGIEYISELLVRCKVMEDTYRENLACTLAASSSGPPTYLVELNASFRAQAISIYSQILKYQISLSQQYARRGLFRFLRDCVIADDWQGMLESIKATEEGIDKVLDTLDSRALKMIGEQIAILRDNADDVLSVLLDTKASVEKINQSQLLGKLHRVEYAAFNTYKKADRPPPICLEGTRVDILHEIQHWGDGHREECILWVKGLAGTGKSTLARTIAHHFHKKGRLGASFFFSRGKKDLGVATAVLTTIAVQLAEALPDLKNDICDVIEQHGDIGQQPLYNQWRRLIFQPLLRLDRKLLLPIVLVFVLDALDECEGDEHLGEILQLLTELRELEVLQVKVFLTSRPERSIYASFRELPDIVHHDLTLHSVPKAVIESDISIFLRHELEKVKSIRRIDERWPGDESIQTLVQKADRLFIYAATVCRFIGESRFPEKRMDEILHTEVMSRSSTSELDRMYSEILNHILDEGSHEDKEDMVFLFKQIVGSLLVLAEALSRSTLTSVLDLSSTDITEILESLHSVLDIPEDENLPIQLFHLSFRDFVFSEERCANPAFTIKEEVAHGDMCDLRHPGTSVADVEKSTVEKFLPQSVQYACKHWIRHLDKSQTKLIDNGEVHIFLQKHLLHWIEGLSLMGIISDGIVMVRLLETLVMDTMTGAFRSAFPDVSQSYFAGGTKKRKVALSPDGKFLAITSAFDDKIRIWDSKRAVIHSTLEGHVGRVSWIAFSPDGNRITFSPNGEFIAGYRDDHDDHQVRLWDAKTNCSLGTLTHSHCILTLEFSHDGKLHCILILGWCGKDMGSTHGNPLRNSYASQIRVSILDVAVCLFAGWPINCVYITWINRNSKLLVTASGRYLKLWDPQTKTLRGILAGHTSNVTTLKFSSTGQLASGSVDRTVKLWDTINVDILDINETHISELKFMGNGHYVVSYSTDETTELWDPSTGISTFTIPDFVDFRDKVEFSPANNLLAYTDDDTIHLWNMATGKFYGSLVATDRVVRTISFSPNGNDLAASYQNHAIIIWDLTVKKRRCVLKGHVNRVNQLAYSSNGRILVSASMDASVQLWDPATGGSIGVLQRRAGPILAMTISSDAQTIISKSASVITVWDTNTKLIKMEFNMIDKQVVANAQSQTLSPSLCAHLDMLPLAAFDWNEDKLVFRVGTVWVQKPWVVYQLQNVLWLPGQYRSPSSNSIMSIHDNIIALRGQSKPLMLVKLDLKSIPSRE
ncbi:WD domain-containing protein [Blastomyces dermatitidis ER-3]|nr:WD domain-containing protein [Blastomyces dermatitidis ER-3]EEQ83837.2 WD domain-containing protein [Blastomyces dermatitidis ER-3]